MLRFKDKFARTANGTDRMGFGETSEIANAVLFPESPKASSIYGTELTVDAGFSVIR